MDVRPHGPEKHGAVRVLKNLKIFQHKSVTLLWMADLNVCKKKKKWYTLSGKSILQAAPSTNQSRLHTSIRRDFLRGKGQSLKTPEAISAF